ncbi:MAG: G1 family glutamic endopeptidase [Streptosporangiaceae bacterium]
MSGHARKIKGLTKVVSNNWSGYADTGSSYSTVTGSWTESSVSCTSTTSLAAFWVGIDGFSSTSARPGQPAGRGSGAFGPRPPAFVCPPRAEGLFSRANSPRAGRE